MLNLLCYIIHPTGVHLKYPYMDIIHNRNIHKQVSVISRECVLFGTTQAKMTVKWVAVMTLTFLSFVICCQWQAGDTHMNESRKNLF